MFERMLNTSDSHLQEIKAASEFDTIVNLATEGNIEGLRRIGEEGIRIDIQKGIYTPVMWLAKKECQLGVKLLIDSFNADPYDALHGYAMSGRNDLVESLLAMDTNDVKCHLENYYRGEESDLRCEAVLRGYLQGGHITKAVAFASPNNPVKVIASYEQGDLEEQVEALLAIYPDPSGLVEILAQVGDKTKVDKLLAIDFKASLEFYSNLLPKRSTEFKKLIARLDDEKNAGVLLFLGRNQVLEFAISGYAKSGYVENVEQLLCYYANIRKKSILCDLGRIVQHEVIPAYKKYGHQSKAHQLKVLFEIENDVVCKPNFSKLLVATQLSRLIKLIKEDNMCHDQAFLSIMSSFPSKSTTVYESGGPTLFSGERQSATPVADENVLSL